MQDLANTEFSLKELFSPLTTAKAIIIISIVGFIVYFNSLFGEFVADDISLIINNPVVHSLNNAFFYFFDHTFRFYRPLTLFFYTILYSFFGEVTVFYHFLQVSIHIANASLVYLLFKKFYKSNTAFLFGIIFLIHPINVESVAPITSLQDVLFTLFGLSALFLFQKPDNYSIKNSASICVLLLLSLLSKETGIIFIAITVIFTFIFRKNKLKHSFIISLTTLFIYGCLRFFIAHNFPLNTGVTSQILHALVFTTPKMFFYYIKTFFYPKDLAYLQLWLITSPTVMDFYLPLLMDIIFISIVASLGFILWRNKKKEFSIFIFFLLWFVLGICFVFPIWLLDATVAERWFYIPIIGLLGILALLYNNISFKRTILKNLSYALIIILLSILAIRTMQRNQDWFSISTLAIHDAPITHNTILHEQLESELLQKGNYLEAAKQLPNLIRLDKNNSKIWYYKAIIELQQGNQASAESYLEKLFGTPNDILAYQALAQIYLNQDRNYSEAQKMLKQGLQKYSHNATLWQLLAIAEYKLGNLNQAHYAAEQANIPLETILSGAL